MKKVISLIISALLVIMSFAVCTSAFAATSYSDDDILKNRAEVKKIVADTGNYDGAAHSYTFVDDGGTFNVVYDEVANTLTFNQLNDFDTFKEKITFTLSLENVESEIDVFSTIESEGVTEQKKTTINLATYTEDTELSFDIITTDLFGDEDHAECVRDCMHDTESDTTNNLGNHLNMLGFASYEPIHVYDEASPNTVVKATKSADGSAEYTCSLCGETFTKEIKKISKIVVSPDTYKYDGKQKTPAVIVYDADGNEIGSKYYTVSYPEKRKDIGTYQIKVEFKTLYSGTETASFKITGDKTTKKKNTSKNAPKTGAVTVSGLGMIAAGAAILTVLKRRDEE